MNKRAMAVALVAVFLFEVSGLALDSKKAMYVGGTIPTKIKEGTEGRLKTDDEAQLVLIPDKGEQAALPYAQIESYEYGQKASHRIKTAILLTPWSLFSKKRRHYYSLMWKDADGKDQGIVLEVGKDLVRPLAVILKAKTGKDMVFQDEEAKKNFGK